jgi:hypothetical protein
MYVKQLRSSDALGEIACREIAHHHHLHTMKEDLLGLS